jgi:hypothetical protein
MPPPPIDTYLIGAQKSGTSSLGEYIGEHPQVLKTDALEFGYFVADEQYKRGYDWAYRYYFDDQQPGPAQRILAKSASLYANEKGLTRLYQHNPACQLLLVLRNPCDRAFSSFLMEYNAGNPLTNNFSEYLQNYFAAQEQRQPPYRVLDRVVIDYGKYDEHLANVLQYFPRDQLYVLVLEEFRQSPRSWLADIYNFLGIDASYEPEWQQQHNQATMVRSRQAAHLLKRWVYKNPSVRKLAPYLPKPLKRGFSQQMDRLLTSRKQPLPTMAASDREQLMALYEPHIQQLEALLGQNLDIWRSSPSATTFNRVQQSHKQPPS